jgi:hypothetical protein
MGAARTRQKGDRDDVTLYVIQKGHAPMDRKHKQSRRAEAAARRERLAAILTDLDAEDERRRADAVRALCPCQADWPRSIWEHIYAACEDSSPVVRMEALHVLEDTPRPPDPRVMRALRHARGDPDPRVADAAARYLNERKTSNRRVRQGRYLTPEERERRERRKLALLYEPDATPASEDSRS